VSAPKGSVGGERLEDLERLELLEQLERKRSGGTIETSGTGFGISFKPLNCPTVERRVLTKASIESAERR
jgi:hypothetical protein